MSVPKQIFVTKQTADGQAKNEPFPLATAHDAKMAALNFIRDVGSWKRTGETGRHGNIEVTERQIMIEFTSSPVPVGFGDCLLISLNKVGADYPDQLATLGQELIQEYPFLEVTARVVAV